jgi:antitoxin component YwqK of YwqJK toxin-antitoxin module
MDDDPNVFHYKSCRYEGPLNGNGVPSGNGTLWDKNGKRFYDGAFKKGCEHGFGVMFHKDGITVMYAGHWKYGRIHGKGRLCDAQGTCTFAGAFKTGRRHGVGQSFFANGLSSYSGEWLEDKRDGEGSEFCFVPESDRKSTMIYQGLWRKGVRSGIGRSFDINGRCTYDGMWEHDLRHGNGTAFNQSNVAVYVGDWQYGLRHGQGLTMTYMGDASVPLQLCSWKRGIFQGVVVPLTNDTRQVTTTRCAICLEALAADQSSYAYVPCGHRALCGLCEGRLPVESPHRSKCMICRCPGILFRIYG